MKWPTWNFRKSIPLGLFRLNLSKRGLTSISAVIGRWGWNSRTGKQHYNTPGLGSITWGGRKRRRS